MKKLLGFLTTMLAVCGIAVGAGDTPIQNLRLVGNGNGGGNSFTNLNNMMLTGNVTFVSGTNTAVLTELMVATLAGTAPTGSLVILYAKTPTNNVPSNQVATVEYVLNHTSVVSNVAYASIAGVASNVTSGVTNAFDGRYLGIGSNAVSASYASYASIANLASNALIATNSYRLGGILALDYVTNNQSGVNFSNMSVGGNLALTNAANIVGIPLDQLSSVEVVDPPGGNYQASASSGDGTRLVIAQNGGLIWTSTDAGTNWINRESSRAWAGVASSFDGTKLVAASGPSEQIYTSTDAGTNWVARDSTRFWQCVASSSNGTLLVAGVYGGQIYTSTDAGTNWIDRESSRDWRGLASSADGTKLVAVVQGGFIYTSTDAGTNWTQRDSSRSWGAVASSDDGTKLVAGVFNGGVYTSIDAGTNWIVRSGSGGACVSSSADGRMLASGGGVFGGSFYISSNAGTNWTTISDNRQWWSIASSADGNRLLATSVGSGHAFVMQRSTLVSSITGIGNIYPAIGNAFDLGSSDKPWKDFYQGGWHYWNGGYNSDEAWRMGHDSASSNIIIQVRMGGSWSNAVMFLRPGYIWTGGGFIQPEGDYTRAGSNATDRYLNGTNYIDVPKQRVVVAATSSSNDVTVATGDVGTTYVFAPTNSDTKTYNLPSGTAGNVGMWYTFVKQGTGGVLSVDADVGDIIDDSQLTTNTYYSASTNKFNSITIMLVNTNWWHVLSGRGTWTATQ